MIVHRFNRIAWGQVHRDRSRGVIAAGMENGELALWDPAKIISNAEYVYLPTLFIG
jgi:protein transport protein SEC31